MPDDFDIDDGALGLEAIWTWSVNGFVFNDQAAAPNWVHLSRITGLFDGPDHDLPADKRVGRPGETPRPSSAGGKTVVLEGEVRATTLAGLRSKGRALRAAFASTVAEGTMTVAAHADLGGLTGTFTARALALTMDEVQATTLWRRPFALSLRLSDPRVYFPSLAVDVTHATGAAVTNSGTAPADPVITIAGASGDVAISDGTSTLTFADVPAGTLVVNFAARTAKVGVDHARLVVASSDWWDSFTDGVAPGASVTVTQAGGSSIRVQFTPAVW